jgi:UDP-N-acetylglucosamine--N-acetylmuramyl-(pentapeptide) pyrophosphoryl-undecaprenol N-acetylglucosamine transferase
MDAWVTGVRERASGAYRRCVAIACGGTAGHVYPALALGEAFGGWSEPFDVVFFGTSANGFEGRILEPAGFRLEIVRGSPLLGTSPVGKAKAMTNLAAGVAGARRLLGASGAALVVGFGGYASAGAVLAGRSLGLPTAIHEANVVPGLANRLLARVVDRVYVASDRAFESLGGKRVVTGTPIRRALAGSGRVRTPGSPVRILVTGGSLGSAFLNEHAPELLGRVVSSGVALLVTHQSGDAAESPIAAAYDRAGVDAAVVRYLDDMARAYGEADFAVARAGAGTIAELAAAGLPSLLVPLPGLAGDHQTENARAYCALGAGILASESGWESDGIAARVGALLDDTAAYARMSARAREAAMPDAASRIVRDLASLLDG